MFPKSTLVFYLTLLLIGSSEIVVGRHQWLERDNRPVYLYPRRFGQEQPAVLEKLRAACPGEVCGNLAGQAVTPLLAAQPECSQQDLADAIIDASKQFDAATQANMIEIAREYRQAEKNTPPDFSTNPPTLRNSVFCQKAPKNPELNGLVQAQDPANDPNLFFDPALRATVTLGSQANTQPFGGAAQQQPPANNDNGNGNDNQNEAPPALPQENGAGEACPTAVTVTVTGAAPTATADVPTVTVGNGGAEAPAPTAVGNADFGSCSVPQIEFAAGFDNRRETSFRPVDPNSFSQGSAQNINIVTRAMCDQLVNTCQANQAARDLCAQAQTAAAAATRNTGAQADAFNAIFGVQTNFNAVQPIDDRGNPVGTAGSGTATQPGQTSTVAPTTGNNNNGNANTGNNGNTGNTGNADFGSCSVPQIEFAAGFDNRRETSFRPVDPNSFTQGSAQNIDIVTRAMCDQLVNTCQANQAARDICAQAQAAASAAAKNTGAQADAFNAVFGVNTNFNAVTAIDNTGAPVPGTGNGAVASPAQPAAGNDNDNNQNNQNQNNNQNNDDDNNNGGGAAAGGNLQQFTGSLGGVVAPTVTDLGNGRFQVQNNASFNNLRNARVRSCDVQNNQCANASNGNRNAGFSVGECNAQQAQCIALAGN